MKLIVYYDEDYANSWLPKSISIKIRDFLKEKGFTVFNAEDLAEWMEQSFDADTCWNSLVVFSQDVVPETVCNLPFPNSMVRSYLDSGGTIVWIGDVPFYYRGYNASCQKELSAQFKNLSDSEIEKLGKLRDKTGKFASMSGRKGCFTSLGVIPIWLEHPSSKVKITKGGRKFGLRTRWYSNRPILLKGSNLRNRNLVVLAKTKPRYLMSLEKSILSEQKERRLPANFVDFMSKIIGIVPAIVTSLTALGLVLAGFGTATALPALGTSVLLLLAYAVYWLFWSRSTYASAWFINFDKRHPLSGFIRLWDFVPWRITDSMLEELYGIVLKRKELSTLSSEPKESTN